MCSSLVAASCPPNSHYEVCADTCDGTCASFIYPSSCSKDCFEGCKCDAGFVFDGTRCVPLNSCGCVYNGKYLTVRQNQDFTLYPYIVNVLQLKVSLKR